MNELLEDQSVQVVVLPLWRATLEDMRKTGLTFGKVWALPYFETWFRCGPGSKSFAFELMALRVELEEKDGYYLRSFNDGKEFRIVLAEEVEDVAHGFENRMMRLAGRSIKLRKRTLNNPQAVLTKDQRKVMEGSLERASIRLVLLHRQNSITALVNNHKPALLK